MTFSLSKIPTFSGNVTPYDAPTCFLCLVNMLAPVTNNMGRIRTRMFVVSDSARIQRPIPPLYTIRKYSPIFLYSFSTIAAFICYLPQRI